MIRKPRTAGCHLTYDRRDDRVTHVVKATPERRAGQAGYLAGPKSKDGAVARYRPSMIVGPAERDALVVP
jgi:hypothetical protein